LKENPLKTLGKIIGKNHFGNFYCGT